MGACSQPIKHGVRIGAAPRLARRSALLLLSFMLSKLTGLARGTVASWW